MSDWWGMVAFVGGALICTIVMSMLTIWWEQRQGRKAQERSTQLHQRAFEAFKRDFPEAFRDGDT